MIKIIFNDNSTFLYNNMCLCVVAKTNDCEYHFANVQIPRILEPFC